MYYPGTDIEVERYMTIYKYVVLYRYKPELGVIGGKVSTFGLYTPRQVVEEVRHVKECGLIMDLIGVYRIDGEIVRRVEVVLAHEVNHED